MKNVNNNWFSCIKQGLTKEIKLDRMLLSYLLEAAKRREETARMLPLTEVTKETVISLFYDVLRELLEALALQRGYKIYNHECYTYFLQEIIKDRYLAAEFNIVRLLRNRINYYGGKILMQDATRIITQIEELIKRVRLHLRHGYNH